jgi:hypothetical protein
MALINSRKEVERRNSTRLVSFTSNTLELLNEKAAGCYAALPTPDSPGTYLERYAR